jgi:hypothetical protein
MSTIIQSGTSVPRPSVSDLKLAYLRIASPRPNLYIGGLMVVDSRGLPLEFRYTEPIQPTKLQQILYGAALTPYLKRDVILETLLKQLESRPCCLIVGEDSLVGIVCFGCWFAGEYCCSRCYRRCDGVAGVDGVEWDLV